MTRNQQTAAVIGAIILFVSLFAALEYSGLIHHTGCCPCANVTP